MATTEMRTLLVAALLLACASGLEKRQPSHGEIEDIAHRSAATVINSIHLRASRKTAAAGRAKQERAAATVAKEEAAEGYVAGGSTRGAPEGRGPPPSTPGSGGVEEETEDTLASTEPQQEEQSADKNPEAGAGRGEDKSGVAHDVRFSKARVNMVAGTKTLANAEAKAGDKMVVGEGMDAANYEGVKSSVPGSGMTLYPIESSNGKKWKSLQSWVPGSGFWTKEADK